MRTISKLFLFIVIMYVGSNNTGKVVASSRKKTASQVQTCFVWTCCTFGMYVYRRYTVLHLFPSTHLFFPPSTEDGGTARPPHPESWYILLRRTALREPPSNECLAATFDDLWDAACPPYTSNRSCYVLSLLHGTDTQHVILFVPRSEATHIPNDGPVSHHPCRPPCPCLIHNTASSSRHI